jgi:hypothetical protein
MGTENIANAPDGLDTFVVCIDFGAKTRHNNVHYVGLWVETVVPYVLEDHRLAHRTTGMTEQKP